MARTPLDADQFASSEEMVRRSDKAEAARSGVRRISSMLPTLRNVAIIAAGWRWRSRSCPAAAPPRRRSLTAISMAFLAAIAFFVYRLYREQQMTMMTLSDGRRAILFGAVGAIALLIVGFEEFTELGRRVRRLDRADGSAALLAIFLVWREASTYT